ncbi:MAG: insulinase family protein [Chthoniobacterales bacterium]|nr:insulinase family protein [Chthoniobacterales bacterium]
MLTTAQLNPAPPAASPAIVFPPVTAQQWTLPNGLTIIVQIDRSAPVASVQAWCGTGSVDEDSHLGAGLSHILEHMLFKGTTTRTTNAIAQSVQDQGGYINAYTSFDRTVYWIDVPKEGVASALEILSDAMMNSTLPADEYVKEQEVIRREFAMSFDDPDRMIGQLIFKTAYQRHPYRLPVIGEIQIFDQLTQKDVIDYYKARYVPNNLTFVVVGDVDADQVYAHLAEFYKSYPERSLKPVYVPAEPPQFGRREVNEEFSTELARLALSWHIPEITHPDVPALDLLATVLGDGRSSRLYRKVREEAGLAFSLGAFSYTPGDPGLLGVDATVEPQNRVAAEEMILQIVAELAQNGASAEELAKAKKIVLSHSLGSLTTMRGQASDLGANWLVCRNLNFTRDYLAAVQKVTRADLQRVAAKYLVEENLTVVSLNPRGTLPAKTTESLAMSAGEIQKFKLSNGLRLLVRQDPRLPLVSMVAVFRGGLLAETPETNGITRLLAKVLLKGTATRTAEEIADIIEAVGGGIGSDAGNNSFSISLDVTQPDLRLGAGLLSDILLHATLPEKAIAREKEAQLAGIRDEEERLTTVARNILRAALFPQHPYALRGRGTPASVAALTQADLLQFRDRLLVANNGVISVFGNVQAEEVKEIFEQALATMTPGALALTGAPQPPLIGQTLSVEENRDKAQGVLMVGFRGADMFSPDRYALELIDEASSDLGSRFFVRIREQLGLAYYVGASQMQGLVPGLFAFYLGTDPQKIEQVKAELLDEIEKLAAAGLTNEELVRAKKKLIGQQRISNQSNDSFGYMAALDELYGLGFEHYKELEREVNLVTVADIRRVAAQYFQQPYVLATVQPSRQQKASLNSQP